MDHEHGGPSPVEFWEQRYGGEQRIWSGKVNASLALAVPPVPSGGATALDLGCGEGGDVLWLASQGWSATGVDLSETAISRAREEAAARGLSAQFVAADLASWADDVLSGEAGGELAEQYDLVTASFLQSPVHFPRERVLRAAARTVAPGGTLIVISHGAPPPWANEHAEGHGAGHGAGGHGPGDFPTPDAELATLELSGDSWDNGEWAILAAELREREVTAPDGSAAKILDTVIIATRAA